MQYYLCGNMLKVQLISHLFCWILKQAYKIFLYKNLIYLKRTPFRYSKFNIEVKDEIVTIDQLIFSSIQDLNGANSIWNASYFMRYRQPNEAYMVFMCYNNMKILLSFVDDPFEGVFYMRWK